MKKMFSYFILICLAGMTGCDYNGTKEASTGFILNGYIKGLSKSKIVLSIHLKNSPVYKNIDSTFSENGKFVLSGKLDEPCLATIIIDPDTKSKKNIDIVGWIENSKMNITGDITDKQFHIKGSLTNDLYEKYTIFWTPSNASEIAHKIINSINRHQTNKDHGETTKDQYFKDIMTIINKIPSSFFMLNGIYNLRSSLDYEQMDSLMSYLQFDISKYPTGRDLAEYMHHLQNLRINAEAPEFMAFDTSGNRFSFSSYKEKIVLLNFWASWCRPCINEIPTLKKLYDKYHNDDFEVIGVAIQDSIPYWKHAVCQNNIPWPNFIASKDTDYKIIENYCLSYIPQNILISRKGKILARNIEMDSLDFMIKEYTHT